MNRMFNYFFLFVNLISVAISGFSEYVSQSNPDKATTGLVFGIAFSIITLAFGAGVYFMRDKIAVAIALIKESSK